MRPLADIPEDERASADPPAEDEGMASVCKGGVDVAPMGVLGMELDGGDVRIRFARFISTASISGTHTSEGTKMGTRAQDSTPCSGACLKAIKMPSSSNKCEIALFFKE